MCETKVCSTSTRLAKAFVLVRLAFASDRLVMVACGLNAPYGEKERQVLRSLSYLVTTRAHNLSLEFVAPEKVKRYDTTMRATGPGMVFFITHVRGWRRRVPALAEVWDATV